MRRALFVSIGILALTVGVQEAAAQYGGGPDQSYRGGPDQSYRSGPVNRTVARRNITVPFASVGTASSTLTSTAATAL
jgi:hypothetical protein